MFGARRLAMNAATSAPPVTPDPAGKSGVWTVHSSMDNKPQLRGFTNSEAEADELLARLKGEDADAAETTYWTLELSNAALGDFRDAGMLPPGF
jgi:hypothetical protein